MTTTVQITPFRQWIKQQVYAQAHSGECRCQRILGILYGRTLTYKTHCPQCGSGWTICLASKDRVVKLDSDEFISANGHKCRKCGTSFDEWQAFTECVAPPTAEMIKRAQQEAHQAASAEAALGMPVDKFKEEINRLRVARGEEPL